MTTLVLVGWLNKPTTDGRVLEGSVQLVAPEGGGFRLAAGMVPVAYQWQRRHGLAHAVQVSADGAITVEVSRLTELTLNEGGLCMVADLEPGEWDDKRKLLVFSPARIVGFTIVPVDGWPWKLSSTEGSSQDQATDEAW